MSSSSILLSFSLILFFFFPTTISPQNYEPCDCSDFAKYTCIPNGNRIEVLSYDQDNGVADYAYCSVYPYWEEDPIECPFEGNGQDTSHFSFLYDPFSFCVNHTEYHWSVKGCSNADNWDPVDIDNDEVTDFDNCNSIVECGETRDPSCSSFFDTEMVTLLKCNYEVTKGKGEEEGVG